MFLNTNLTSLLMLLTFITVLPTSTHKPNFDILHQICCHTFGHKNASEDIQEYFDQAKMAFEIKSTVPAIKQINNCPFFKQFSSFTWAGTWINADEWNTMSPDRKTWESFHEVSHTALNHPIKQVGVACAALVTSMIVTKNSIARLLIAGALLYTVVPWYVRKCEKEADIAAATKLSSLGKTNIVQQQIEDLKDQSDEPNSAWFNSPSIMISYLQKVLDLQGKA